MLVLLKKLVLPPAACCAAVYCGNANSAAATGLIVNPAFPKLLNGIAAPVAGFFSWVPPRHVPAELKPPVQRAPKLPATSEEVNSPTEVGENG